MGYHPQKGHGTSGNESIMGWTWGTSLVDRQTDTCQIGTRQITIELTSLILHFYIWPCVSCGVRKKLTIYILDFR